ncbi:MAG: tetratricopeptide repeat protein [Nitrospirae bacterium]|nr:tetratricopeptide repeat protein [Nitrospirota bacterium]
MTAISTPARRWLALTALLLGLALALYGGALNNPFHFDDRHGIAENHTLRDPANIPRFFAYPEGKAYFAPSEPQAVHYRPLLLTSYALDFAVTGEGTAGFHVHNLLLHGAGALLVAALGNLLGLAWPWAAGAALVFLAHPLQSEAVNYITARSSLQSGVLSLAAVYAFARSRRAEGAWPLWLALCALLTVAAVLSKEVAVTVPLMCLLYDLLYPPPRPRRWGVRGFGLDLGLMAAGLMFLFAMGFHRYFQKVLAGGAGPRGIGENLWLQARVLVEYLRLSVLPTGLSIVHDFGGPSGASAASIGAALCLVALAVLAWVLRHRVPLFGMGLGLFVLVLLPTTILPMNTPLQESRGYAAVAGVLLALAALAQAAARRFGWRRRWAWLTLPLVALLGAGTVARGPVWGSGLALWSDAVAKAPGNFRAHANLGTALHASGNYPAAVAEYRAALAIYDGEAAVYADLGGALTQMGRHAEAKATLIRALQLYEPYAHSHFNMGILLEREGNPGTAMRAYRRALELVPSFVDARVNLAILMARGGNLAGATAEMETALEYDPRAPQTYVNLMSLYVALGRSPQAHALMDRARENGAVTPFLEAAYARLATGR